jgi:SAM-dependent methyltransferase
MTTTCDNSSLQAVHELLEKRFAEKRIRIYEAGGGSMSFINSAFRKKAHVTVLDIDRIQLQKNVYADDKVLGDVQEHAFPRDSFDLIVCYNVMEHLTAPDRALQLFFPALAPGGLLFIGAPNPSSFSGWVTKLTPHWFHVWYYKYILRYETAGQPGDLPFRTVFHPIVTPATMMEFCRKLGFRIVYFAEYQGEQYDRIMKQRPLVGTLINAAAAIANAGTLWKKDLKRGDFHIVLEKPAGADGG